LHIFINQLGEIIKISFTSGNVHDVKMLDVLSQGLSRILPADKGYISKAKAEILSQQGCAALTMKRKNMKNPPKYSNVRNRLLLFITE